MYKPNYNRNKIMFLIMILIGMFLSFMIMFNMYTNYKITEQLNKEIQTNDMNQKSINILNKIVEEKQNLISNNITEIKQLNTQIEKNQETIKELEHTIQGLKDTNTKPAMKNYNNWDLYWEEVALENGEIDFFAKLLHAEAGGMGYEGQFWVASAILNLSKRSNMSIYDMGHNIGMFAVAPYVDTVQPTDMQYQIIHNVLKNGWIKDVCYFRTDYPHSFGRFMRQIENVCFNAPN